MSATHLDGERGAPVTTRELVAEHLSAADAGEVLVMLGPGSELGRAATLRRDDLARAVLASWREVVDPADLLVEMVSHRLPGSGPGSSHHVARMLGMAVALAVLTAYGSTTIDRLSAQVYATPDAYLAYIPEDLRDRPLKDPLVVEALETWASREAASIMVGLYLVAALVTLAAVPPALILGGTTRRGAAARMLPSDGAPDPGLIL